MARMMGERVESYQARRAFQAERIIATQAWEAEREIKRLNGIPLVVVELPPACPCAWLPFPHVHSEHDQRMEGFRFHADPPRASWLPWREKKTEDEAAGAAA